MLEIEEQTRPDITIRRPVSWISHALTDNGTVRTVNEDAILDCAGKKLWVVADGMGGHDAGDIASRMIVDSLSDLPESANLNDYIVSIEKRILDVNERLLEFSEIMLDGKTVGSTFIGLLIYEQVGVVLWMGDSRLYLHRGNVLTQISEDHSHIMELLKAGAISEEEARDHPDSNIITRAVGTTPEVFIDIDVFDVKLGDTLLLCSDGLYNSVAEHDISASLSGANPEESVTRLIDLALENGAADNVSAIVIKGVRKNVA